MIEAVKHVWQAMCKPNLDGKVSNLEEWGKVEYETLNFGPTYELGRGILQMARDMTEGNLLLPTGKTNKSFLAGWAITEDRCESQVMPYIGWKTGSKTLGRSMSEMGVAFKMKSLPFISGDECGDVPQIWTFTNNTLLPRLISLDGSLDLVGTVQPSGTDYMRMIEMAEEDMKRGNWKEDGLYYTQRGSMYENSFLPRKAIEEIERIADPIMRRQIIDGDYVEAGEKYFGYERVSHSIDPTIPLQTEGYPGRKYVLAVDFAGGKSVWADHSVLIVVDFTQEPYKVVYFNRFKGGDIPLPAQYKLVEDVAQRFQGSLVIDSTSLGGKNAYAFLAHLRPISFDTQMKLKMEMLMSLKIAFDGGQSESQRRERDRNPDTGKWEEKNKDWGLIRFPEIPPLISELTNYRLDDTKISQDCVMTLGMAIHYIELRRPKVTHRQAVSFDLAAVS